MNIGERIKQRRLVLGMSVDELALMVNKNRATIYRYEKGDIENLPTTVVEPLADALSTTPEFLMGWTDDPRDYENDPDIQIPSEALKMGISPEQWAAFQKAEIEDAQRDNSLPADAFPYVPEQMISIPLIGSVNCGTPLFAEDNIEGYIPTPESDIQTGETYFWLRAKGDSMINVGIHKGDLLLIRQQDDVDNGDIAVVVVNGYEATLKRVKKQENAIILQPENPNCETRIFIGKDMKKISIRGRLMQLRKDF